MLCYSRYSLPGAVNISIQLPVTKVVFLTQAFGDNRVRQKGTSGVARVANVSRLVIYPVS